MVGVAFSIIIAFMGLVGYIGEESLRRSKEIAIRKVNGATALEIITLFVKDIGRLLIIAILVEDAVAYYTSSLFLQQFASKIPLSIGYFLAADVIVAGIILLVVVLYGLKISYANPIVSLKNE